VHLVLEAINLSRISTARFLISRYFKTASMARLTVIGCHRLPCGVSSAAFAPQKKLEHDGDSPHHALKETGIHFQLLPRCLFGRRGLFCILLETEVCQKTTEVPSGSVATIAEDTGAADSHRNLRGNVQRYGGVQRMLKRDDVEQSAAATASSSVSLSSRIMMISTKRLHSEQHLAQSEPVPHWLMLMLRTDFLSVREITGALQRLSDVS